MARKALIARWTIKERRKVGRVGQATS